VHDIGELIHGDKNVFIKQAQDEVEETTAALGLLDERHHDLYLEFEAQETNEAKFAKSIDKIAPDILDVLTDRRVTTERLQYFAKLESGDIALAIEAKKSPHMQWSTFFRSFHADLITNLKEILPPKDSK